MCTTSSQCGREKVCSQNLCTHEVNSVDQLLVLVFRLQSGPLVRLFTHTNADPARVATFENLVDTLCRSFRAASLIC